MTKIRFTRAWIPWIAAVASGVLQALCFAPYELKDIAWFALVPLILSLRNKTAKQSLSLAFVAGATFWLFSLHWLTHVSYGGWIALAGYCALYQIPLALVVHWWDRRIGLDSGFKSVGLMFVGALVWAASEFVRARLFTGFAWNCLGVSQHTNLTILQIASWGGVYAVSFVMVMVNMAFALTIHRYIASRGRWGRRWHPELMIALLVWALVHAYGLKALTTEVKSDQSLRLALIQPNIPQIEKWTVEHLDKIYNSLELWTLAALQVEGVDLVVWPETALPDDVRNSPRSYDLVYRLATNGVPLLVGSMDTEWTDEREARYFNSSFLFDETGAIVQGYDKQHLVIFGEYVPLDKTFPLLNMLTPISESFTPGKTGTVFRLNDSTAFSVLICFEDTVSHLARRAVKNGARLLVNQSNDAWFDPSSGSKQHMRHCIVRCIETGVPAVRSTNTGMTCAIDPRGRVHDILDDGGGNLRVGGFRIAEVDIPAEGMELTFYTRYGDLFAWSATSISLLLFGGIFYSERKRLRYTAGQLSKTDNGA